MIIGRIKHFGNQFSVAFVAHDFVVIALREQLHVEFLHRARTPKAQHADRFGIRARDHHVERNRLDFFGVVINGFHAVIGPLFFEFAVETHDELLIGTLREPGFAAGKPDVGHFDLPAVDDFLLKQSVLITDRKAHRGIILRGESV